MRDNTVCDGGDRESGLQVVNDHEGDISCFSFFTCYFSFVFLSAGTAGVPSQPASFHNTMNVRESIFVCRSK